MFRKFVPDSSNKTFLHFQEYQQKMLYKEKILIENKCNYLFLFSSEMKNGSYKEILQNKINEILQEVA